MAILHNATQNTTGRDKTSRHVLQVPTHLTRLASNNTFEQIQNSLKTPRMQAVFKNERITMSMIVCESLHPPSSLDWPIGEEVIFC